MGLLKLKSIYKKKSKKEVHTPALPSKPEPLSLELNLHSSIDTPVTSPLSSDINNTVPAGSGSLFDDIFAELGTTKPTKPKETVLDNDFSLALALSQQLEIDQDSTTRMTGTTKIGNKPPPKIEKKANDVKPPTFLLGGDSIYSNYLRGLSALDTSEPPSSSSLSTSMFDSILNKSTTTATSGFISPPVTSPTTTTTPSNHVTQVVLDSDISDSDDSKLSDDSDEESNMQRSRQRMTKGVRPIMERRTQDNRVLVQRRVDNWSNRVDPEQNTAELNESMIERMKDRHRNQVKMAALRNQQQYQDEYNYPQHMVPQSYVPPAMMALPPNGVLQHPGLLMDPVQMYYPPPVAAPPLNNNDENIHQMQPQPIKPSVPVPAAFLPNPTHASLAIPHPPKEEEEEVVVVENQQRQSLKPTPQRKSYFGPQPPINPSMPQSNNQSRISGSTTNISSARLSSTSSSASGGKHNSSTATLERIEDEEEEEEERLADSPVPMDTPSPVLEERRIFDDTVAAEEADAENSGDEDERGSAASASPRRKRSSRKLRQSQHEAVAAETTTTPPPATVEDSSYTNHTVRASRSTPNFKKGKKKSTSRNSSRRNSQDMTGSTPSESVTPPPLPHNSPYISYQAEENLYHVPRSSSQHQLHQQQLQYHQNQQHRQSLRHMKSEPELPRRTPSANSHQAQQQKLYQQQKQLNMEWERMQSYQREQLLKQQHQQQPPFVPMYPMYYKSHGVIDKQYAQPPYTQPPYTQQQYTQPQYTQPPYDPYQGPAYNVSSHSKNKPNYYQQSSR
ncbi:hypothetical protein EDC94DRAFT_601493 [Helicostylum pulchrum]|nr:hypothetical protein EDC94DRAFT_601493 [Helicostylum pulchrum]